MTTKESGASNEAPARKEKAKQMLHELRAYVDAHAKLARQQSDEWRRKHGDMIQPVREGRDKAQARAEELGKEVRERTKGFVEELEALVKETQKEVQDLAEDARGRVSKWVPLPGGEAKPKRVDVVDAPPKEGAAGKPFGAKKPPQKGSAGGKSEP